MSLCRQGRAGQRTDPNTASPDPQQAGETQVRLRRKSSLKVHVRPARLKRELALGKHRLAGRAQSPSSDPLPPPPSSPPWKMPGACGAACVLQLLSCSKPGAGNV